ncbi:zinc ribbon domain-containing protein [Nocardioides pakistanensis]
MPYQGERASRLGHVATAQSDLVTQALSRYRVAANEAATTRQVASLCAPLTDLDLPVRPESVSRAIALDGSASELPIAASGGRTVRLGFVRVAGVALDLDGIRDLSTERFIDPVAESRTRRPASLDYALPGAGVSIEGRSSLDSYREAIDSMLADAEISDVILHDAGRFAAPSTISLAEALLTLHGAPGAPAEAAPVRSCPSCRAWDRDVLTWVGPDGGRCPECNGRLYLADALGLSVALTSESAHQNALTLTMNAAERLATVGFLELLRRRSLAEVSRTLVVLDGPMAAFGPLQQIAPAMRGYLDALGAEVLDAGHTPLLVVGVEKGGDFVTHADSIADLIDPGYVMRLTESYIADRITGRSGSDPYGASHLYGRRFFYRRRDGQMLTVTVPAASGIAPWSVDPVSEDWASYPTLRPVIELLESLRSVMHKGAVLPLVLAHQVASLPMGTGRSVLTVVGQQGLGLAQNTRLVGAGEWG